MLVCRWRRDICVCSLSYIDVLAVLLARRDVLCVWSVRPGRLQPTASHDLLD